MAKLLERVEPDPRDAVVVLAQFEDLVVLIGLHILWRHADARRGDARYVILRGTCAEAGRTRTVLVAVRWRRYAARYLL